MNLQSKTRDWSSLFSNRIVQARTSFIREILKVTADPEVISFAGGLPSPELFPVEAIAEASSAVLSENGQAALQYTTTEGYGPLREWIVQRYHQRFGLEVSTDEILITTGSQQALDLLGKTLVNPGDGLLIEKPGYLGAIQSFSLYEPRFLGVKSGTEGLDANHLEAVASRFAGKLLYTVPNFQNPSGSCQSLELRERIAQLSERMGFVIIEDDPYGELRYRGKEQPSLRKWIPDAVLLGSFSKIIAPGFRLGWICAPRELIRKLTIAKQAADLHSDIFAQRVLHRYLQDNNLESHLKRLRQSYGAKAGAMVSAFRKHLPEGFRCNDPEGGMFLWAELPESLDASELIKRALEHKVAFVPGFAFYCDQGGSHAMRLNFTGSSLEAIELGMARLAASVSH